MERIVRPLRGIPALLFILICGFARPANASIVYVNKNAAGTVHDGAS